MENAVRIITSTPRSCTVNFIISSTPRNMVNIELTPDASRTINPSEGFLVHANHFSDPSKISAIEPPNPRRYLSEFRSKRLEFLLRNQKPFNIPKLKKILSDHENFPQSLCRHRDSNLPTSQHTTTKTSMIMDITDKKIWVTDGSPCDSKIESFTIS